MRLIFDVETNALDFSTGTFIDQVTDVWCIVAYDLDEDKWYQCTQMESLGCDILIELLEEADELIGHNILQFDIPVLNKLFGFKPNGRIRDTLVTSRVLYPDRPGGHSLRAWGERLGDYKEQFTAFDQYSTEMLEYCKQDVKVNALVYKQLLKEQDGNWDRALDLEHRIAEIIAEQERRGFWFNKQEAQELTNDWDTRINDIDSTILGDLRERVRVNKVVTKPFKINGERTRQTINVANEARIPVDHIGGPFCSIDYYKPDLNSKKQQKELLLELGWKPVDHTPTGLPKIDESILQVKEIGSLVHERNLLTHRYGLVDGLVKLTDENSRVHGGANPCGTNTGRMRHTRIVNIPRPGTPYGAEIRSLFGVPDQKVLVGYDAASLELRILAHYIGNPDYNATVTTEDKTKNAHTLAAEAAQSSDYNLGKTINYALIYGAGDAKLGQIIGGTKRDGAALRKHLYNAIPGLSELIARVTRAARKGYLKGLDGRKLWIRQPHMALNTLVQGGGAVFMKTVTENLDANTEPLDAFKVIDMHDEAQWECPPDEVDLLSIHIHMGFSTASKDLELTCVQEAEIKTGTTWLGTH